MFFIKPKAKFIYSLEVPDMHCGMCEAHIEDIIRKSAKIKNSRTGKTDFLVQNVKNQFLHELSSGGIWII